MNNENLKNEERNAESASVNAPMSTNEKEAAVNSQSETAVNGDVVTEAVEAPTTNEEVDAEELSEDNDGVEYPVRFFALAGVGCFTLGAILWRLSGCISPYIAWLFDWNTTGATYVYCALVLLLFVGLSFLVMKLRLRGAQRVFYGLLGMCLLFAVGVGVLSVRSMRNGNYVEYMNGFGASYNHYGQGNNHVHIYNKWGTDILYSHACDFFLQVEDVPDMPDVAFIKGTDPFYNRWDNEGCCLLTFYNRHGDEIDSKVFCCDELNVVNREDAKKEILREVKYEYKGKIVREW